MKRSSQLLIGAAAVLVGALLLWVALREQEESVTTVPGVLQGRADGVLAGVPQPHTIPLRGNGGVQLAPNPAWSANITWQAAWREDGLLYHSTYTLHHDGSDAATPWTFRNETRRAGELALARPVVEASWSMPGLVAVPVEGFHEDEHTAPPRVWAVVAPSILKEPLQPKPSQLTGSLLTMLPDGTAAPDGLRLWQVSDLKVGCSSKFLPPAEKARQAQSTDA